MATVASMGSGAEANSRSESTLFSTDPTEFKQSHWDSRVIRQLIEERFGDVTDLTVRNKRGTVSRDGANEIRAVNIHDARARRRLSEEEEDRPRKTFRNVIQGIRGQKAADDAAFLPGLPATDEYAATAIPGRLPGAGVLSRRPRPSRPS